MIYSLLKQGADHKNWCEDFNFFHDYEGQYFVSAVFDGCSSGRDSHFASTLFARLFENTCKEHMVLGDETPKELSKQLLYSFSCRLKRVKEDLGLNTNDLLATIILLVRDVRDNSGYIAVIGDGFVSINGQRHEIEQSNAPNYIAYHLGDINDLSSFENWYDGIVETPRFAKNVIDFTVPQIRDVTIATDGITSYVPNHGVSPDIEDPAAYLSEDIRFLGNPTMLERKVNILRNKGWNHRDDLGIYRIVISDDQLHLEF